MSDEETWVYEQITQVSAEANLSVYFDLPVGMFLTVQGTANLQKGNGNHMLRMTVIAPSTEDVKVKLAEARKMLVEVLQ